MVWGRAGDGKKGGICRLDGYLVVGRLISTAMFALGVSDGTIMEAPAARVHVALDEEDQQLESGRQRW